MRILRASLVFIALASIARFAMAVDPEPCKECFLGFCQQTPYGVIGKVECNDTPNVEFTCGIYFPGGFQCGLQISPQCNTTGDICMNWLEAVEVSDLGTSERATECRNPTVEI